MTQLIKISVKDQREKDFEEWLFLTIFHGEPVKLDRPLPLTFPRIVATVNGTSAVHLFYPIGDVMYVTELGSTESFKMVCDPSTLLEVIALFSKP